jgi:hypothetical protein
MPASLRRTAIAVLLLAAIGTPAPAAVPDPSMSTLDGDLMLGNARGMAVFPSANVRPTLTNGYRIVVRDAFGVPIPGAMLTIGFFGTGVRPHAVQTGGQTSFCPSDKLFAATDASGSVTLFPGTVGMYTSFAPEVEIVANGVLLARVRFRSFDLVATPGAESKVDLQDLAQMRLRYFNLEGEADTDPETDFATEGPSAGKTDGFDINAMRLELLCGTIGAPIPEPCSLTACP